MAINIYEQMFKTKVLPVGYLKHPEYNYLGASPDGLILGPIPKLIEIKCPMTRRITSTGKLNEIVPMNYYD